MSAARTPLALAIGEAMIEMAPVGDGLYRRGFAGDCFNTAWHMARTLGPAARVGFVSRVGRDAISDAFVAQITGDGLIPEVIARDPDRTMGLYMIALEGAERSFHYWRNSSAARHLADDAAWLDQALTGADLIHLSGITLAILSPGARATLFTALDRARQAGAQISFDPNIRPALWSSPDEAREVVAQALRRSDIALPSFDDEAALWGDPTPEATITRLQAAGVAQIAVKNGADPVVWAVKGSSGTQPTPAAPEIRDTTGAGDAFNAGFLSARLMGSEITAAIAAGQQLSAELLRHFGARIPIAQMPQLAQIPTG